MVVWAVDGAGTGHHVWRWNVTRFEASRLYVLVNMVAYRLYSMAEYRQYMHEILMCL